MKKTIAVMLVSTLSAVVLSACFFIGKAVTSSEPTPTEPVPSSVTASARPSDTEIQMTTSETAEPTAPAVPARLSQEEQLAVSFVEAMLREDYASVLEMLSSSVYPDAPVFEDDIQWALPRTDFKVLKGLDPETVQYTTVLDHGGNVAVTVSDASGATETVTVRTEIPKDGDGSPKVNGSGDFYRTRYGFRTPSNVQVEINGVAVDKAYITKKNSGSISMYTDWMIPVIGIKDKTVRLSCDCFDASLSFTPKSWSDPQNDGDCRHMPAYEDEDILQTVKTLWNDMYAVATASEAKASDLYPFIASDADPDTAQIILDAYRQLGDKEDKDIKMTQAAFRTDGTTFWANDHCLVVNLAYELTWDYYGAKDMKRKSHIILAKEGDAWKVYRVTDAELFSYKNYFTSEW